MSEKEKDILKTLSDILPQMSEGEKMYLLGQAEGMAFMKQKQNADKRQKELQPV